ncbi:MAG: hypothetical protein ACKO3T_28200 [Planctomycetaceae bacterium]
MLTCLPELNCPDWLQAVQGNGMMRFCVQNLLKNSLFYPCCQFDGTPVKFLGGNVFSFVYADHAQDSESLQAHLARRQNMFRGYTLLASQVVCVRDFWQPDMLHHDRFDPELNEIDSATWLVFQRLPNFTWQHGPERFSLLYIHGDGILAYQALYVQHRVQPLVFALIQPGNAANTIAAFGNDDCQLAGIMRQNGFPAYFLSGGYGEDMTDRDSAWPRAYPRPILTTVRSRYYGTASLYRAAAAAGP